MSGHRFRHLLGLESPLPAPAFAAAGSSAAFVPCPMLQAMSPAHQSHVEYLYRLAFEQAQAQVAQSRRVRRTNVSWN